MAAANRHTLHTMSTEQGLDVDVDASWKHSDLDINLTSTPSALETDPDNRHLAPGKLRPFKAASVAPAPLPPWYNVLPATDHVELFVANDWASSILGPLDTWDRDLQLYTCMVLTDSNPACLYVGKERIAVYNAAFAPLVGTAHPALLGTGLRSNLPEMDHTRLALVFEAAETSGRAVPLDQFQVFMERNSLLTETYFTGSFNPLRGLDGKILAIQSSSREVTRSILSDRRATMLTRMELLTDAGGISLAESILPALEGNKQDIPMALLYEVDEDALDDSSQLLLRGQIGVPSNHHLASAKVNLNSKDPFALLLREARDARKPQIHPVDEKFLGIDWQGFGEASKYFSILPLASEDRLFGFLVVGANPRRPVDDDYFRFMKDLASLVTSISTSVATVEDAKKSTVGLKKKLAESDNKIRFMAQHCSVGMLHSSTNGELIWANEEYWKLTGHTPHGAKHKFSFLDLFVDEDHAVARSSWSELVQGKSSVSVELHMKKLFTPPSGDPEPFCILAHSFPYFEDGHVKSIMTCISDISALKWAEKAEARKAVAAADAKKSQEEFMDMVSHEIRNPLSAIYTSADTITKSLTEVEAKGATQTRLMDTLKSNVDWAQTIMSAAKLQKCIVDDILTLSKLQYELISIKPQPMQLPRLVESTAKMFESDMTAHGIKGSTSMGSFLKQSNIDWVLCDPSRLTQILVNFLTNAIKFTKSESERKIIVSYEVATSHPREVFPEGIHWAPVDLEICGCVPSQGKPGDPKKIYLTVCVKDTGVGMNESERQKLFSRFAQASESTSVKYGGSGLGLFISKRLTEKLGGEIGVASEPGVGSTFVFYVEAERAETESSDLAVTEQKFPLAVRTMSGPIDGAIPADSVTHCHVLIAEDNLLNQTLLAKQLRKAGCVVTVANNGSEALQRMRESDVWHDNENGTHLDLVLMDWQMPIMDGLAACRKIRNLEKEGKFIRHAGVIVLTANARDEHITEALEAGADTVIAKPFFIGEVLRQMRECLAHSTSTSPSTTAAGLIRTSSTP
ncbi:hypothetical protein BJ875DRAFT_27016 [Amylocarpus encephaloides]|uniref:histidine kinase n=1 Tax=Amylocarpus encephaloides TaxID=45428 RepID=A0A9P7YHS0_9HELO|nr:hypothetical protein BJ875DRAFT_27016 [Amylocarpus encephaloides]